MKKSALTFLAAVFALSLSSCGNTAADEQVTAETVQTTLAETAAKITEAETKTTTTTSETTEATTTVTETEKVCTCESDFQHACCEYLNGLNELSGGVYYGDINGDGKPEAIVEQYPHEGTAIFYKNENGIQFLELKTVSVWGEVSYAADTNRIFFTPMRGHTTGTWGYEEHYIYEWNGSDYVVTTEFFRESGYPWEDDDGNVLGEWSDGYINGEFVEHNAFEEKLAEFVKQRDENPYFPIAYIFDRDEHPNPNPETYINYIKENFPCFDNWDIIE